MNTRRLSTGLLQAAMLTFLIVQTPAVGQATQSNQTSTDAAPQSANSEVNNSQNPYNGMGGEVPVRKDAWTWYWNEKAHIDIDEQNSAHFWGDDAISNLFRNFSNSFVIPFWNAAMEYDFIRAALLLILAGMLLGIGASIVNPKKPENKIS